MRHLVSAVIIIITWLGLAGCGDGKPHDNQNVNQNACDGILCGGNAHCDEHTDDCECDTGFTGDPDLGCTARGACQTDTCSGHGTCEDTSGVPVCRCDPEYSGARCESCNTDFDLVSGACVNQRLVDCADISPPASAHQVESQVVITFASASGWSSPAACAWACDSDYHREDDVCVETIDITWCTIRSPIPGYSQALMTPERVYAQLYSNSASGTAAPGPLPGVLSQLCYSSLTPIFPSDPAAMTCIDAQFNADDVTLDEYVADLAFGDAGTYYYFFIFSGDGGDTWTVCDTGGIEDDPSEPGMASIHGGSACDVSGWTLAQFDSSLTYQIPSGTIIPPGGTLVVGRGASRAAFELAWGVTLDADVLYLRQGIEFPIINGLESYVLYDADSVLVDGPTVAMPGAAGQSVQRVAEGDAAAEASWTRFSRVSGTPGTSSIPWSGAGVLISEFSDAVSYQSEFVELVCDNP